MKNINIFFLGFYSLISLFTALIGYVTMVPLIEQPTSVLICDACSLGVLLGILSFLLGNVFKYVYYKTFPLVYRSVSQILLAVLFISFWIGGGLFFIYVIFGKDIVISFLPTLPLRVVVAALVFNILVMYYKSIFQKREDTKENTQENIEDREPEKENTEEIRKEIDHITIKNGSKIDLVYINEIYCIQAQGDYIMIYTEKGKFLKEQTMKSCEEQLSADKFIRVHRSSIVNKDFIARLETYEKQSYILILQNGMQVKVSLSGYKALKAKLGF